MCANAQLTVFENGHVHVGNYTTNNKVSSATLDISDHTATNAASGSISFGPNYSGASIKGCSELGTLNLFGGKTLTFGSGETSNALIINGSTCKTTSYYPVSAPSFLTTSDARFKKNVEPLSELYMMLQDINPVSYNLSVSTSGDTSIKSVKDSSADKVVGDNRTHFGFIAQEVQKIFPNLVVEDEEGMLAIDYTGFIPLLVDAYRNLSDKVKEQEEVIEFLIDRKGPSFMPASVNGPEDEKASLKQNKPNPFNTTTVIECTVPRNVGTAFICVYDLQGKQVYRIDIRERGDVVNVIDASYLAPGMYIYSLIADGVEIDSKRMIITD